MSASSTATLAQCPTCGRGFACDPDGTCWCATLPPVTPRPEEASGCFCPDCLAKRAAAQQAELEARP
jgi:hypothetical protein